MPNEIRADMLKVKRMISEVEMIIGKREGETELVNKLIDAENLLTYCMSRLENAVVPPCKVGVQSDCNCRCSIHPKIPDETLSPETKQAILDDFMKGVE